MEKENLVFLPTYNEEENLKEALEGVRSFTDENAVDILVVDDGSTDRTVSVAKDLGVKVLATKKNYGNGYTSKRGFDYAIARGYLNVVKLDADGQHAPSFIPRVLELLRSGISEFIICSRYHPLSRRISEPPDKRRIVNIMITEAVNKLTNSNLTDVSSGFCGYTANLLKSLEVKTRKYGAPIEMVIRARMLSYQIFELPHPVIYKKPFNPIRVDQYIELFSSLKDELKFFNF